MLRIGFFQFAPQDRSPEDNVEFVVGSLANEQDCLIVLPEFFLQSYTEYKVLSFAEVKKLLNKLLVLSKQNKLTFVGSLPVKVGNTNKNRCYLISQGKISQIADKKKLYANEQKTFSKSTKINKIFTYKGVSFCAYVCFDVIDPQMMMQAMKNGVDICLVIATVSVDFLRTITKARSLENQIFTVFANRSGKEKNGITYLGISTIFSPDGKEVSADSRKNQFCSIAISTKELIHAKKMRNELGIKQK